MAILLFPEFPILFAELAHARAIARGVLGDAVVPNAEARTAHVAAG